LTDKTSVFIPAKRLSYMTGIELGYRMGGLHWSSLLAEAGVLVDDETQREMVIESLKTDCEVRTGSPPGL
jgi:hypothetical protein